MEEHHTDTSLSAHLAADLKSSKKGDAVQEKTDGETEDSITEACETLPSLQEDCNSVLESVVADIVKETSQSRSDPLEVRDENSTSSLQSDSEGAKPHKNEETSDERINHLRSIQSALEELTSKHLPTGDTQSSAEDPEKSASETDEKSASEIVEESGESNVDSVKHKKASLESSELPSNADSVEDDLQEKEVTQESDPLATDSDTQVVSDLVKEQTDLLTEDSTKQENSISSENSNPDNANSVDANVTKSSLENAQNDEETVPNEVLHDLDKDTATKESELNNLDGSNEGNLGISLNKEINLTTENETPMEVEESRKLNADDNSDGSTTKSTIETATTNVQNKKSQNADTNITPGSPSGTNLTVETVDTADEVSAQNDPESKQINETGSSEPQNQQVENEKSQGSDNDNEGPKSSTDINGAVATSEAVPAEATSEPEKNQDPVKPRPRKSKVRSEVVQTLREIKRLTTGEYLVLYLKLPHLEKEEVSSETVRNRLKTKKMTVSELNEKVLHTIEESIRASSKARVEELLETVFDFTVTEYSWFHNNLPKDGETSDSGNCVLPSLISTVQTVLWLKIHLYESSDGFLNKKELYTRYEEFCTKNEIHCLNQGSLGKLVNREFAGLRSIRKRSADGVGSYYYCGLELREESEVPILPMLHRESKVKRKPPEEEKPKEPDPKRPFRFNDPIEMPEPQLFSNIYYESAENKKKPGAAQRSSKLSLKKEEDAAGDHQHNASQSSNVKSRIPRIGKDGKKIKFRENLNLIKKPGIIILPDEIVNVNVNPVVSLNSRDVDNWYKEHIRLFFHKFSKTSIKRENENCCIKFTCCDDDFDINSGYATQLEDLKSNLSTFEIAPNKASGSCDVVKISYTPDSGDSKVVINKSLFGGQRKKDYKLSSKHVHPSIRRLKRKFNIQFPVEVLHTDVHPVVVLNSGEVVGWYQEHLNVLKEKLNSAANAPQVEDKDSLQKTSPVKESHKVEPLKIYLKAVSNEEVQPNKKAAAPEKLFDNVDIPADPEGLFGEIRTVPEKPLPPRSSRPRASVVSSRKTKAKSMNFYESESSSDSDDNSVGRNYYFTRKKRHRNADAAQDIKPVKRRRTRALPSDSEDYLSSTSSQVTLRTDSRNINEDSLDSEKKSLLVSEKKNLLDPEKKSLSVESEMVVLDAGKKAALEAEKKALLDSVTKAVLFSEKNSADSETKNVEASNVTTQVAESPQTILEELLTSVPCAQKPAEQSPEHVCFFCCMTFDKKADLDLHKSSHVTCLTCKRRFKNTEIMRQHLINHCNINRNKKKPFLRMQRIDKILGMPYSCIEGKTIRLKIPNYVKVTKPTANSKPSLKKQSGSLPKVPIPKASNGNLKTYRNLPPGAKLKIVKPNPSAMLVNSHESQPNLKNTISNNLNKILLLSSSGTQPNNVIYASQANNVIYGRLLSGGNIQLPIISSGNLVYTSTPPLTAISSGSGAVPPSQVVQLVRPSTSEPIVSPAVASETAAADTSSYHQDHSYYFQPQVQTDNVVFEPPPSIVLSENVANAAPVQTNSDNSSSQGQFKIRVKSLQELR